MPTATLTFRDELLRQGLLIQTGVAGVYGRSAEFEDTLTRLDALVSDLCRPDAPTVLRFPPVLNRVHLERSGYLKSFPHLAGSVHSFAGDDRAHRELLRAVESGDDWSAALPHAGVMLTPAACYPVYPTFAGELPEEGRVADVLSYCFRHEPSDDPARMQAFRMRENVRLADPERVKAWRDVWFERAGDYTERLGLDAVAEVANDPFFGRGGKLLARNQRDLELKFEIVAPIAFDDHPTAVISLNYHQDHFAQIFGITTSLGETAHSACIGFGLERLTLAMYRAHGFDRAAWPAAARRALDL